MMRVDYLAKMSKSQAKKRLLESSVKIGKVYLEGQLLMSPTDRNKLVSINNDLSKLITNLNADSEDVLRRLELIGNVTNQLSSSGAIPGTIQYFEINGVNNGVSYVDFGPGVWRVMDIVAVYSGGSGTITFRAYHYNGVTPLEWYYAQTTSTSLWVFNGGEVQTNHIIYN